MSIDEKSNSIGVEEEILFTEKNKNDNGVEEEVLFKLSNNEDLEFVEPQKPKDYGSEVLFSNRTGVNEESLIYEMPSRDTSGSVSGEVLFRSGVEELNLDVEKRFEIAGEDIQFAEPVAPTFVDEEVLFKPTDEVEKVDENAVNEFAAIGGIISEDLLQGVLNDVDGDNEESVEESETKVYIDKCFAEKMLEADSEIIERYNELKNVILSYKHVKSRISNNFDSFNMGRTQLFKLATSGKSLKLYLNLNYEEVETRLKCKDVSDKKSYAEVPVFLRIKSPRAMRNAKYLIGKVAERFNLQPNKKFVEVDSVAILKQKLSEKGIETE